MQMFLLFCFPLGPEMPCGHWRRDSVATRTTEKWCWRWRWEEPFDLLWSCVFRHFSPLTFLMFNLVFNSYAFSIVFTYTYIFVFDSSATWTPLCVVKASWLKSFVNTRRFSFVNFLCLFDPFWLCRYWRHVWRTVVTGFTSRWPTEIS